MSYVACSRPPDISKPKRFRFLRWGLSFCLEGKNMNGHSDCDENEYDSECQMFGYENGTADKTGPKRGDGNDLHFQRDSLVKHKILDVRSKSWMIHQPVVQPF